MKIKKPELLKGLSRDFMLRDSKIISAIIDIHSRFDEEQLPFLQHAAMLALQAQALY